MVLGCACLEWHAPTEDDMKTDAEVKRTHDDREMMLRPHLWPLGDALALKRRGAPEPGSVIPYHFGRLLREPDRLVWTVYAPEGLEPVAAYPSLDALLADGWIVD